jgi:hypothetical protein
MEDGNEGEPTSTETSNLTSINEEDIEEFEISEIVDNNDDFVNKNNTTNIVNDANSNILARLTAIVSKQISLL